MQKHKFSLGDIVRLKPDAKNWVSAAHGKDHVYGEDLIAECGYSVRQCVDEYPEDFILVKKHFEPKAISSPKPHKHAELIKKWADGAKIEYYDNLEEDWFGIADPHWNLSVQYREVQERKFPETSLSFTDLDDVYNIKNIGNGNHYERLTDVANAAIKQYILDTEKK
jgi:hypothetical protein